MNLKEVDREKWLDIGVGAFALSLLVGAVLWIFGQSMGKYHNHKQKSAGPASPGTVPPERHQNIKTVAAR